MQPHSVQFVEGFSVTFAHQIQKASNKDVSSYIER